MGAWLFSSSYELFALLLTARYRLWIVVPTFIVLQLGKDLAESLNFAARASQKISTEKRK